MTDKLAFTSIDIEGESLEAVARRIFDRRYDYIGSFSQSTAKPVDIHKARELLGLPPRDDMHIPPLKGVEKKQ